MPFQPYFYILCKKETSDEVSNYLTKKFIGLIARIQPILKEDLDLVSFIVYKTKYQTLQSSFYHCYLIIFSQTI